jgi:tRNA G18 (ribose-2'-O)-methylase SpoU
VAAIIPIDDPGDPRIAVFRQVRERDVAGRGGGFIAEGEVVLRVLARSDRHRARALLIAEQRLAKLAPLIEALGEGAQVFVAGQGVMDAIAGFPIHRGILAHGLRGDPLSAEALLAGAPPAALVVVLFGMANHDNMGGVFRNAAAFGASAVLLDSTCCDPLYRKAIRVSVGAALSVPFAWLDPLEDPVALLVSHGFVPLALSPAGRMPLADLARPRRAAVMLGSEGPGLPAHILAQALSVSIPMAGAFDSLNVATTSGIVLHHLASSRPSPPAGRWFGDERVR